MALAQSSDSHYPKASQSSNYMVNPDLNNDSNSDQDEEELYPPLPSPTPLSHRRKTLNRRRKNPIKWSKIAWVAVTSLLIATLGYTSQLFVILPYYQNTPTFTLSQLVVLLAPFNLGLALIFYNYYLCIVTDPGQVPLGWEPDWTALDTKPPSSSEYDPTHDTSSFLDTNGIANDDGDGKSGTIELKTSLYRPRYCKSCKQYKPPRAHHCKTCRRCVLRMDHHCPWVANCVGHFNYAHFLRFLFYVDFTCTYHLVMLTLRIMDHWNSYTYWQQPSSSEFAFLVINYALCIPVLLLVGTFSIYHFYCLCVNQTTIESWEKDKVATMIRRGKIRKIKYPYHLGFFRNIKAVLGSNPLWWWWPFQTIHGDGTRFQVSDGIDPIWQYRWPPKDPTRSSSSSVGPALFSSSSTLPPTPFTYGSGFNPSLVATNSTTLRNRITTFESESYPSQQPSPYNNDNLDPEQEQDLDLDSNSSSSLSSGSDDDVQESLPNVRLRRGSEGWEVRPTTHRWMLDE